MQCALCQSKSDLEEVGEGAWLSSVCHACSAKPDVVRLLQDLWLYSAVLETGGSCVSDSDGKRYTYERKYWSVTFRREELESAIGAKSERALYAALYRWHRDPEKAYPPGFRRWVQQSINLAPRSHFERFCASGESGIGVLYAYDGSGGREFSLGLSEELPHTAWELLQVAGISVDTFPGKFGFDWMSNLFGVEVCGQGAFGIRFRTSHSEEVEIPARLVNLRAEGQIRQIIGRSAASSA